MIEDHLRALRTGIVSRIDDRLDAGARLQGRAPSVVVADLFADRVVSGDVVTHFWNRNWSWAGSGGLVMTLAVFEAFG